MLWGDLRSCDIEWRFQRKLYLAQHEIEDLVDFLGRPLPRPKEQSSSKSNKKIVAALTADTKRTRIQYAVAYIDWLSTRLLDEEQITLGLEDARARELMISRVRAATPGKRNSSNRLAMKASTQEDVAHILDPSSPSNPFAKHTRSRNFLIYAMLDELGIRSGELLALKVSDFDFRTHEVSIRRNHHDPVDPRPLQPVGKTLGRLLAVSPELTKLIHNYVQTDRRNAPAARHHPFLFVTHSGGKENGAPLTLSSLRKFFMTINDCVSLEHRISAHILRHNAATRIADHLDATNVPEAKSAKILSYMFGWQQGSGTAARYIKRRIIREAHDAQRKLQRTIKL